MIVTDDVRKCVVFIGIKEEDNNYKPVGTAFFIGRKIKSVDLMFGYLLTAKHVIDGLRDLGLKEVYLRINLDVGGAGWTSIPIEAWRFHPTDKSIDVAATPFSIPHGFSHLMIPLEMFATQEIIAKHKIGVGDEVFITGLFRHHHGQRRNIPIIRVGNLAAMNEEKIITKDFGEIEAYLIEARSIGGLSGSPVFLNLGFVRQMDGQTKFSNGAMIFFLGLIHGHFDQSSMISDSVPDKLDRVNTGIAIVVPSHKVLEVLNHPDFVAQEEALAKIISDIGLRKVPGTAGKE